MAWESENFISVNAQSHLCCKNFSFPRSYRYSISFTFPAYIVSQVVIGEHTIRSDYSVSDDDDYDDIRLKDKVTITVVAFILPIKRIIYEKVHV